MLTILSYGPLTAVLSVIILLREDILYGTIFVSANILNDIILRFIVLSIVKLSVVGQCH